MPEDFERYESDDDDGEIAFSNELGVVATAGNLKVN